MSTPYKVLLDAPTETGARIPVARLGDYHDTRYGEFSITENDVKEWQDNLAHLPGQKALVDEDHLANKPSPHRRTESDGWISSVELGEDGKQVWGNVEWTPRGKAAVEEGRYLFTSPTFGPWKDDSGTQYENVLSGVSLTNRPFLTSMPQIMLASDEAIQRSLELDPATALLSLALDGELGEAAQTLALEADEEQRIVLLDELSTNARNNLKDSDFALEGRRYPIHDLSHARNALARVAANGNSDEQAKVKAAVYRRYPTLKPAAKNLDTSDSQRQMKFSADTVKALAALAGITDEEKINSLIELGAADDTDEAKMLEAIEAAKPEPEAVKTLEELAEEKGVKVLSADEYESLTKPAETPEGTKTLEEQAQEAGKALVDEPRLKTLEDTAAKVPGLEVAVKHLTEESEKRQKELDDQRFENAYDTAEREGRAVPAQKEGLKKFFELDAEGALATLAAAPQMVNVKPQGRNIQPVGDDVPAGQHAQHYELEQRIADYMTEHEGADYAKALDAVAGINLNEFAGAGAL